MHYSTIARLCSVLLFTTVAASAFADDGGSVGTKRQALGEQCSISASVGSNGGGCGGVGPANRVDATYYLYGVENETYALVASYIDAQNIQHFLPIKGQVGYQLGDYYYAETDSNGSLSLASDFDAYTGHYVVKLSVYSPWTGAELCSAQSRLLNVP